MQIDWADSKYDNHALIAWLGPQRIIASYSAPKAAKGFVLLPKRWGVQRTFSRFGRWWRLLKANGIG
ncbi:transposase [Rhodopirellula europaea 6C]|uniref:Transposase n=1 Tax=Rhodopirellula europaea 6C TaxID=1263867 RepID=M2B6K3_9BACT|nr:transposase [Rhodopirellula europaea 6C]